MSHFKLLVPLGYVTPRSPRSLSPKIMTLVYCGSLASVHSHKPASPSCVSASCSTPVRMLLFLAQVCKHCLASWSIGVVGNCLIGLLIGFASQPARSASLLGTCGPDARRHTSTRARYLWLRAVNVRRAKRLSKSVGQKLPVKVAPTSIT